MTSENWTWTPPSYNVSRNPTIKHKFHPVTNPTTHSSHNFARTAKWCPDGNDLLLQCEDHTLQIFNWYPHFYPFSSLMVNGSSTKVDEEISSPKISNHQSPLVDFAWFPYASSQNPAAYCYTTSVRDTPVHLIDAKDGRLRASYSIVDHRERQIAPHCLVFSPHGERLYCGFENAIEIFNVSTPGAEGTRLHTTPSKKTKDGLKGLISSIAFSGTSFAAGSLAASPGNTVLFDERQGDVPVMYLEGGPNPARGVTQLQFNPTAQHILYAAYRRHTPIYGWDLRTCTDPFAVFDSQEGNGTVTGGTNQRMWFDVEKSGKWAGVGTKNGQIAIFDLNTTPPEESEGTTNMVSPKLVYSAHEDVVASVAFRPTSAMLCSVSGSRHFMPLSEDSSSEDEPEVSEHEEEQERQRPKVSYPLRKRTPGVTDSFIKLWDFSEGVDPLGTVL